MKLKGEGNYIITNVKEIKVTKDFLDLDVETKGCQNQETLEECITNKYFSAVTNQCNCVPFSLRNYSSPSNMNVSFHFLDFIAYF